MVFRLAGCMLDSYDTNVLPRSTVLETLAVRSVVADQVLDHKRYKID